MSFDQSGVDLSGKRIQLLEGVAPIEPGNSCVLALKENDRGRLTLLSGPYSPQLVSGATGKSNQQVVEEWQSAVSNQVWPEGLAR
jgi:hypothetical protein